MFDYSDSDRFVKINDTLMVSTSHIISIDYQRLEKDLEVIILLSNNETVIANDAFAIELLMQCKPSALEGKRLKKIKFKWMIHNLLGHPVLQLLAFFKLYKLAFWFHEVTIAKK